MSTQTTLNYRKNRDLFSNYHLDEHLPDTEAWDQVDEEELQAAYDDIKQLWERQKDTAPQRNESQLEEKFIRPMFRKLGIPFEVEESTEGTQRRPDYGFFKTQEDGVDAFQRREEGGDFYKNAIAVADAKRWGRKLDTRGEKKRDYENPSHQIDQYLRFTSTTWGVLTNGQKWRLYYKPTSHRLDSYYEIDLPTVLEQGDLDDFKYFYLFFRHDAFVPDTSGDAFLDDVYEESNVFAQELGEDLQDNIYEAIKHLAEGYLQYPENDLDEENLELIHDSSLIYLYRIIFVLYAEAEGRDLLNTNNEIYESQYSLNQLKQEVADELESGDPKYRDWQSNLQSRLDELFMLIDQGSKSRGIPKEDLYIPAYNGGLFRTDPDESGSDEALFLANHTVGDEHLARVIELLTRSEGSNGGGKIFVDYSSLDVRHLGSIYEGLLEYQLNVTDEPLALDDGEYVVADESSEVVVERNDVYLTTDSGERKATGSYYTPEYVVEYIVEETLRGPVDEIRKDVVMDEQFQHGGYAAEFAERVFNLKILDPAMGSGHFLTSVVDYLARAIITEQNREADEKDGEVIDDEHDINWARRKVAQHCIYGVDINPLATELAKVSLWLRTLASEQPLAFLDHHLKAGNSLVGSDISAVLSDDSEQSDGQLTLSQSFARARQETLGHVMDLMTDLLAIDNQKLKDIKSMEELYDQIQDDPLYQRLFEVANVHTAEQFGVDVPQGVYEDMAGAIGNADKWAKIQEEDWFKSAQTLADEQAFFHWELKYPEVFFNADGEKMDQAGFDAVIGNPPYVRQEQLKLVKPYLKRTYESYHGVADLYVYFIEKGVDIIKRNGDLGCIVSNKFMRADYGRKIREFLISNTNVKSVVDFGELPVFNDASTFPAILTSENTGSTENVEVAKIKSLDFNDLKKRAEDVSYSTSGGALSSDGWSLAKKEKVEIVEKMEEVGEPIEDYVGKIYYGIKTGYNKAFFIDLETRNELISANPDCEKFIKPLVVGDDVRRYHIKKTDRFVIVIPAGWTNKKGAFTDENEAWKWFRSQYPNIATHLSQFEKDAKTRYDMGDFWWELRECDYYNEFEKDKIIYPVIQKEPRFTIDTENKYPNDKCFIIPKSNYYLLALLNSNLLFELMKLKVSVLGDENAGGRLELRSVHLKNLPIYPIPENTEPEKKRVDHIIQEFEKTESKISGRQLVQSKSSSVIRSLLSTLAQDLKQKHENLQLLNLSLLDHLGSYSEGSMLADVGLTQPPRGSADSILQQTATEKSNLRVGDASVVRKTDNTVEIRLTARYKPEDEDAYETDQWGYTETDPEPAWRITDITPTEADLIEAFVPVAVDEAGGFAGFRESATKTNSLVDRLRKLTLPALSDVEAGLDSYTQTKERAEELEAKIERTDELIDEIVYDLYGLTDEEIEIVESAVADD